MCVFVCLSSVCLSSSVYMCVTVCEFMYTCFRLRVREYVWECLLMSVCMCICAYVCGCLFLCMYVCISVFIINVCMYLLTPLYKQAIHKVNF